MTLFDKSQAAKVPWGTALLTVSTIVLAFIFSARWNRPISQWPIDLPLYRYTFTAHPELHDFDDPAAKDLWGDMVYHDWWATDWRDDTGRRFTRGIDIFHKMHCLVAIREEFVKLATEEQRMGGHDGMAYEVDANGKKVPLVWNQDHVRIMQQPRLIYFPLEAGERDL